MMILLLPFCFSGIIADRVNLRYYLVIGMLGELDIYYCKYCHQEEGGVGVHEKGIYTHAYIQIYFYNMAS